METLKKFKVGLGQENFFNEETSQWDSIDVVYFPMFSPFMTDKARKSHQKFVADRVEKSHPKEQSSVKEAFDHIESEDYELVKVKIRGVGQ